MEKNSEKFFLTSRINELQLLRFGGFQARRTAVEYQCKGRQRIKNPTSMNFGYPSPTYQMSGTIRVPITRPTS
jgi:hypothetical protein